MTPTEKELIKDLVHGNITQESFLQQFPVNLKNDKNYILFALQKAYADMNAEDVEYSLSLLLLNEEYSQTDKYVDILSALLNEKWHYKHEDIAVLLQGLKSPRSVDALYNAAVSKFEYLNYDDSYALARKCIHALGDINTEHSREKLKLLTTSDIQIIKEKAEKQLYFYKR